MEYLDRAAPGDPARPIYHGTPGEAGCGGIRQRGASYKEMVSRAKLLAFAGASAIALVGCAEDPSIAHPGDCVTYVRGQEGLVVKNTCSKVVYAVGTRSGKLTIPAMGSVAIPDQLLTSFTF